MNRHAQDLGCAARAGSPCASSRLRRASPNLPNPDMLAAEIADDLQAAPEQFSEIAENVA